MSVVGADSPTGGPTTTSGADGPLVTTTVQRRFNLTPDDWAPAGVLVADGDSFPICGKLPTGNELVGLYTLDGNTNYSFTVPGTNANDTGHRLTFNFLLYYPRTLPRPPGIEFESLSDIPIVVDGLQVAPSNAQPEASCALMTYDVDLHFNERGVTATLQLSREEFPPGPTSLPRILVTSAVAQYMQVIVGPSQGSTPFPSLGGTVIVDPSTVSGGTSRDNSVPSSNPNAISPPSSGGGPKASVVVPAVLVPLLAIAAGALVFVLWRRRRRSRMAPSAAFRADHPEGMVAIHRDDGAVGYAGGSTSPILAQSPTPAQSPFFPYDNKRPFTP